MKLAFAAMAACALTLSTAALAHDDDHHDHKAPQEHEGVLHYEVETPATDEAALKLIQEKADKIGAILASATLDDNQLESVHEQTYSIEAAINKLRSDEHSDSRETAIDGVDEANQALHAASEDHLEPITREWYGKLQPAVDTLEKSYNVTEATPSAIEE